jgi:phage tail-like protein
MHDIPVVFHFKVEFDALEPGEMSSADQDNRFQEVSGLTAEISTEELREGGLNEYAHRIPTGAKYGNLVLKRGFINSSEVTKWCRAALENFQFQPRNVLVTLLNDQHDPLAGWYFIRAYPVKWSISDLKAQENSLVVESLELAYSKFRKV